MCNHVALEVEIPRRGWLRFLARCFIHSSIMGHERIDHRAELQVVKPELITEGVAKSIHFMFCERKAHEVHDTQHRCPAYASGRCALTPIIKGAVKLQAARLCLAPDVRQQVVQTRDRPEATVFVSLPGCLCGPGLLAIYIITELFVFDEALWIALIIPWTCAPVSFLQDLKLSLPQVYPHDAQRGPELTCCDNPFAHAIKVHKAVMQSYAPLLHDALDLGDHLLMRRKSS